MKQISVLFCIAFYFLSLSIHAQQAVQVGKGSYAGFTPLSKAKSKEHSGDQSQFMQYRPIYITEDNQDKPIPTNKWWTDLLVSQYSGNLWAYPLVVNAEDYGIYIEYPTIWTSDGCEMKSQSRLELSGKKFKPANANAKTWSDWDLSFEMKDNETNASMNVTLAHGIPFTWIEFKSISPKIKSTSPTYFDANGNTITFPYTTDKLVISTAGDNYGIFAPAQTTFSIVDGSLEISFSGNQQYLIVGALPQKSDLNTFAQYAYVKPTKTNVSWSYNETQAKVITQWNITTKNLKGENQLNVMQGFIPHHYKKSTLNFAFNGIEYKTPRGKMKMAAGNNFEITYDFNGILPFYPTPKENNNTANPYLPERMKTQIDAYSYKGGYGADTYWGGKDLIQLAMNMTFAHETQNTEAFERLKSILKEALINWFTYTPGENSKYFARNERWKGLVGYDTSYDSDTFNDHHFHYGYFTHAAAILCMFDDDFHKNYSEMATLVAKDYANWDKNSNDFPLFRTFDIWEGHSYAGGMGGWNGNGQESTSEAMQGWGGMYLLGIATNNKEMRDAAIFGWTLEARGTAEYWFDRDKENINYTNYTRPYNSNLTSQGIGWWTWFSGDPVWMHSIQWLPISPLLKHLYEDLPFARWDYETMMEKKEIGGFDNVTAQGSLGDDSGIGNVVLSYLQIFDPAQAANIFDRMWDGNKSIARDVNTGGITYYLTHSHLTYGDIQWDTHGDMPTSTTYYNAGTGKTTYVVYNPDNEEKNCNFYKNGQVVQTVKVPARKLIAYSDVPVLTSISISSEQKTVEPNASAQLKFIALDQYGATMNATPSWIPQGGIISTEGLFTASNNKGIFTITANCQDKTTSYELRIDDKPVLTQLNISPAIQLMEMQSEQQFVATGIDQYGDTMSIQTQWMLSGNGTLSSDGLFKSATPGQISIQAKSGDKTATLDLLVRPQLSNIALGMPVTVSSEENAGTLAKHATDGDPTTRWGSEHSDPQWIYVDLQKSYIIEQMAILWETAHSSKYEIYVSDNGGDWTLIDIRSSTGGYEQFPLQTTARYVKLNGLSRATTYGHSLYEFELYGIPLQRNDADLLGISIQPNPGFVNAGESLQLTAKAYNGIGQETTVAPVWSISQGEGNIDTNGIFSSTKAGSVSIVAKYQKYNAKATMIIEEKMKPDTIILSPGYAMIPVNCPLQINADIKNQFGGQFDGTVTWSANNNGQITDGLFNATAVGTYTITAYAGNIKGEAKVIVDEWQNTNIALNKPAYTSGIENDGLIASNANDGKASTRWGSAFTDDQWWMVDLLSNYNLVNIEIDWEAASARDYLVQVSSDEIEWNTIAEVKGKTGARTDRFSLEKTGRYIRVMCQKRNTQYGYSIIEFRAYASGIQQIPTNIDIQDNNDILVYSAHDKIYISGQDIEKISLYDISGTLLKAIQPVSNPIMIDMNGRKGLMVVKVQKEGEIITRKVMVK